jgi:hypothetical protein
VHVEPRKALDSLAAYQPVTVADTTVPNVVNYLVQRDYSLQYFTTAHSGVYFTGVKQTDFATVNGVYLPIGQFYNCWRLSMYNNGHYLAMVSSLIDQDPFYVSWKASS